MTRTVTKSVHQREQIASAPAPRALNVVAQPVNTVVAGSTADSDLLLHGLSQLRPKLQEHLQAKQDEVNKGAVLQGAAQRLSDPNMQPQPDANAFFQQGYMQMHGELEGGRFRDDLHAALNDPQQFNPDTDDLREFAHAKLKESMQGMDDQNFLSRYLPAATKSMESVVSMQVEKTAADIRAKTEDGILTIGINNLKRIVAEKRIPTIEERNEFYASGATMRLSKTRMDDIYFKAVEQVALSEGGHPEALDVFNYRSPDGTQEPMATRMQWADKVRELRDKATRLQKVTKDAADQLYIFDRSQQFDKMAKEGRDPSDLIRADVKNKRYSAGHGLSLQSSAQKTLLDAATVRQLSDALVTGDIGTIGTIGNKDQKERAYNDAYTRVMASHPDDEATGIARAVTMFSRAGGVMPESLKYTLNNANPTSNPKAFVNSANLYKYASSTDRSYVEANLDKTKSMQYDIYWNSRNFGGLDERAALERAAQVGTKESAERLKAITGRPEYQAMETQIDSLLRGEFFGSRHTTAGVGYARGVVQDLALEYYATGNVTMDASIKYGIERMKATHVQLNGQWLWTPGMSTSGIRSPSFPDAADQYVADYAERRASAKLHVPENGYYLVSDRQTAIDGKLVLMNGDDNVSMFTRIDPTMLVAHHTSTNVQEKQARRNAENRVPELTNDFDSP